MPKLTTSVYLVLEPEHDYRGQTTGMRFDRALVTAPKLSAKHIAIKVNVAIDSKVFDQFIPEATITVADGRILLTPEVGVEAPPAIILPPQLHDLLTLVLDEPPSVEVIEGWDEATRDAVVAWASASHLNASDHDDIEVPPMPSVLAETVAG
jgi:hypothetical protein